ncbi:hypothetical protein PR048_018265, partial [Dryococelus australis]
MKNRNKYEHVRTVSWLQIRCLQFEKQRPGIIMYRYDHTSPYINIFLLSLNVYTSACCLCQKRKKICCDFAAQVSFLLNYTLDTRACRLVLQQEPELQSLPMMRKEKMKKGK